jgi:uncharacterized protein (TIGR02246 family)
MRAMTALAMTCFVALVGSPLAAQESTPDAALDALAQKYMDGWKMGDASACASVYSEDAEIVDFMGARIEGHAAIQESVGKTLELFRGSSIQLTRTSVHGIKPDLVASDGTWEVMGAKAPGMPTKGFYTVIVAKSGDTWQIIAAQTKVPPSMPPSP